jgi:perosamine synthetase
MWPRKPPDITWSDLASAKLNCFMPWRKPPTAAKVVGDWFPANEAILALSVRSGLDLLLTALDLPPGSEAIVTSPTIPDMARVLREHGVTPVPVAIDGATLEPALDDLRRAITPRTKLLLVAHLLGARVEMAPIVQLAAEHGLMVVEDCAQAYVGATYAGHPQSDVMLFSFGPIKTATSLGGAVVRVRDPHLHQKMNQIESSYRRLPQRTFLARVLKYSLMRLLTYPRIFGMVIAFLKRRGKTADEAISPLVRGFALGDLLPQLRHQPTAAQMWLLARRLSQFPTKGQPRLDLRTQRGNAIAQTVPQPSFIAGRLNSTHTHWVIALVTANREQLAAALQPHGFDATILSGMTDLLPSDSPTWLQQTVFLPEIMNMPEREFQRLLDMLREALPSTTDARERAAYSTVG